MAEEYHCTVLSMTKQGLIDKSTTFLSSSAPLRRKIRRGLVEGEQKVCSPLLKKRNCGGLAGSESRLAASKGSWSVEEDEKLTQLVGSFGPKSWSTIATFFSTKAGKQCRERWHNHLNPDISKSKFTEEEDQILISSHRIFGNRWALIAKHLPGRTDNCIKNRWNSTIRRRIKLESSETKSDRSKESQPDYGFTFELLRRQFLTMVPPTVSKALDQLDTQPTESSTQEALSAHPQANAEARPSCVRNLSLVFDEISETQASETPTQVHDFQVYFPLFDSRHANFQTKKGVFDSPDNSDFLLDQSFESKTAHRMRALLV